FYLSIIGLTRLVFYFHNRWRLRLNILTYFLLSLVKYFFLALILFHCEFPLLLLALLLAFPLPRTLEHACKVKYGIKLLKRLVGEFDLFRVRYYGFLLLLFAFLFWFYQDQGLLPPLGLFAYFFLFRTFVWMMI